MEEEHDFEICVSSLRCAIDGFDEFSSFAAVLGRSVKAGVLADVDRLLPVVIEVFVEVRRFFIDLFDVEVGGGGDGKYQANGRFVCHVRGGAFSIKVNAWYHGVASGSASGFALGDLSIFVALVAVAHSEWDKACNAREEVIRCRLYDAFGVKCVMVLIVGGFLEVCIGVFSGLPVVERCRSGYRYFCGGR